MADEQDLARRAAAGDKKAFEELYLQCKDRVYNYLCRVVGDREFAEDLFQEAILDAYKCLDRYDPSQPFLSWLFGIAHHKALYRLRKRRKRARISLDQDISGKGDGSNLLDLLGDEHLRPDSMAQDKEFEISLQRALNMLNPQQRATLILIGVEGCSYEEAAKIMRCSVGTIRSRVNRARTKCMEILKKRGR